MHGTHIATATPPRQTEAPRKLPRSCHFVSSLLVRYSTADLCTKELPENPMLDWRYNMPELNKKRITVDLW